MSLAQMTLEHVSKVYTVSTRPPGLQGALRGAFRRSVKRIEAVQDLSFTIDPGELVGYIGPNGAGKSTTIKLMSGILVPDAGRIEILGRTPWKQRVAHVSQIGVVFGQRCQLWWDTPVRDSFELLRDIYNVPHADYQRRLTELTDLLQAGNLLETPVRQLSLGQRMRCEFIAALLHHPQILFLDEPTIGLDAVTKLAMRDFLIQLNRSGVTLILTTHDMDDIETLCRRVMVIGRGRLLFDGDMDRLRSRYAPHRILKARLREEVPAPSLPGTDSVALKGRDLRVVFRPEQIPADRLIGQLAAACSLADLTVEAPDVEQLIADMYREMAL